MKLNGFDSVAGIYDLLAKVVFGNSTVESQAIFLDEIPAGKVLILGGGSGWVLNEVLMIQPGAEIWYVDASEKMIRKASKRVEQSDRVHFIHGTEDLIPDTLLFDTVITSFYLDMFTQNSLQEVIRKISISITPKGIWLVTDFVNGKRPWQRFMLWLMYRIFRRMAQVEAKQLPDLNRALQQFGWSKQKSSMFYGQFIEAAVYQRIKD